MAATTEPEPLDRIESRLAPVLLVLIGVLAALCVVIVCLAYILPRDPGPVSEELARQFLEPWWLYPEPTERRIFLTALLLLPAFALAGAWRARHSMRWSPNLSLTALLLLAVAVATLVSNSSARRLLDLERDTTLLWAALLIAVGCLPRAAGAQSRLDLREGLVSRGTFTFVAILAAFLAFSWRALDVRSLKMAIRHFSHLDMLLYTASQAVSGRLPIVDYDSQYGFFGTILAPWFHAVGLSVWSFTLTMCALQYAALAAVAVFVFRQLKSFPLAVGACFAVFFFMGAWAPLRFEPDPYFQVMPVRFLFPALSVLVVAEWLRRPTWWAAALMSLVAGVGIVWNIDSGVAVAGSWLGLLGFRAAAAALSRRDATIWWKRMGFAAGLTALPVLAFGVWLRWRAHAPVDFSAALQSQTRHYGFGYNMLPMPLGFEAWQVVAGIYVVGFVVGSFHALGRIADDRATLLLYLSFLGLGLFPYYEGRSEERVLMAVAWPAVLIAFLVADRAWTLSRSGRLRHHLAASIAAPTLTLGILCGLLIVRDVLGMNELGQSNWSAETDVPGVLENIDFLRESTRGKHEVVILARFQGVYLAETGLASSLRGPGVMEVVTRQQGEEIVRDVERHPTEPVFIGRPYLTPGSDNPFNALLPILAERYDLAGKTWKYELRLYVPRAR